MVMMMLTGGRVKGRIIITYEWSSSHCNVGLNIPFALEYVYYINDRDGGGHGQSLG